MKIGLIIKLLKKLKENKDILIFINKMSALALEVNFQRLRSGKVYIKT